MGDSPAATPPVTVDRDLCIGSGLCLVYAPDFFTHDDDAKAVLVAEPTAADLASVRTAVEACPTSALVLHTGSRSGA
ncbi:ferredoxin [Pseudofrankia inefficax]|uniref:Ferredoxin n=1 Tax=Pseudofrankia inefficax (strain DSM 45817 / CECT 9037 / DDB 130130 / EuI1c) TaxID=298654 RepID=E3IU98_PSEI1|nr:ferredoxin [Pseudofrankia inefficax]ADP82435.1 hypothetical protein FraEuI1c_4441 [Pseudofrankia inefficax]